MLTKYLNLNGCMFCGIMVLLLFIKEYYVSGACHTSFVPGPLGQRGGGGYMSYMFILRYKIYHHDTVYHFQARTFRIQRGLHVFAGSGGFRAAKLPGQATRAARAGLWVEKKSTAPLTVEL